MLSNSLSWEGAGWAGQATGSEAGICGSSSWVGIANLITLSAVSALAFGACMVGGDYTNSRGYEQGFVAVERNGRWRAAIEVPGLGPLDAGRFAEVNSVSCASAGSCAVGGDYVDRHHHLQGFVAVERNGRWRAAIKVPGLGALNKGQIAEVRSVSCASPGNCAACGAAIKA